MIEERFHFYKLREKLPPKGVPVLIKLSAEDSQYLGVRYYVCRLIHRYPLADKPEIAFCEASGEEWMEIDADRVDSGAPIEEDLNG